MTNTRLQLGYKENGSMDVVVPGAITQQQIEAITNNLLEGQRFFASQATVPLVAPTPESMHTEDEPTPDIAIDELAAMLVTTIWDQLMPAFPAATNELDTDADTHDDPTPGM